MVLKLTHAVSFQRHDACSRELGMCRFYVDYLLLLPSTLAPCRSLRISFSHDVFSTFAIGALSPEDYDRIVNRYFPFVQRSSLETRVGGSKGQVEN